MFLQNVDILKDPETVKQLGSILKTNVRACKAVGHPFVIQLGRIYLDMLNVYKNWSISNTFPYLDVILGIFLFTTGIILLRSITFSKL